MKQATSHPTESSCKLCTKYLKQLCKTLEEKPKVGRNLRRVDLERRKSHWARPGFHRWYPESHPKESQSWMFTGRTDAEAVTPILWPHDVKSQFIRKDWCWERLKAGEGDGRGWHGWMATPTQGTWVWVNSGSWWWTGKPGMLQSMGLQRVGHDWATELDWTDPENTAGPLEVMRCSHLSWRRVQKGGDTCVLVTDSLP